MIDNFAKALEKEEKMFEKVKEYLKEHSGETLEDIADHTDVSDKLILKWIDQGRIQLDSHSASPKDNKMNLAEEFNKAKNDLRSSGSRFENASKKNTMHIFDKKK